MVTNMAIYISSKGEQRDTGDMPTAYLNSALKKAQESGNQSNVEALEAELSTRVEEEMDTIRE